MKIFKNIWLDPEKAKYAKFLFGFKLKIFQSQQTLEKAKLALKSQPWQPWVYVYGMYPSTVK